MPDLAYPQTVPLDRLPRENVPSFAGRLDFAIFAVLWCSASVLLCFQCRSSIIGGVGVLRGIGYGMLDG